MRTLQSDRFARVLAILTVGTAVVMVLWNLRGAPWGGALPQTPRMAREQGVILAALYMSGSLTAGVAALRPRRRQFLWFGVLAVLLGLQVQQRMYLPLSTSGSTLDTAPWWGAMLPLTLAVSLLFSGHMANRPNRRDLRFLVVVCLISSVTALLLPGTRPEWLERTNQLLALATAVTVARVYLGGLRDRVPAMGAVVLGTCMLGVAILLDAVLGRRWLGEMVVAEALLIYAGNVTMALVLQLGEAAEWYQEVVEQGRDAVLVVGRDARVEASNPAATAMLERSPNGLAFMDLVIPADHRLAKLHLDGRDRTRSAELRLQNGHGAVLHVESLASPLPEDRSLMVLRDITTRRQLEANLIESARRETAAILAGGIAHDFNNTMGALLGNVELLRMKADDATARRLDRMEAVIRRATLMTRRIVSAVRGGETEQSSLDVAEPIQSASELMRSMLPPEIELTVEIEEDLPRVRGNVSELEHLLLNLLLNARDAMTEGGTIRVQARRCAKGPHAGAVLLAVEDDGPGVPPEQLSRIWEPFYTTKGPGRGTGLGLSVVARVAREHGATVDVGRAPKGRGARFELCLPPADNTATLNTGGSRVFARTLLVDDDPDVREHMRSELSARGCDVIVASTAEEAEHLFDAPGKGFDLLVTDVVLPGRSGITLARRLTSRRPSLGVLIVSGYIPQNEPELDPSWGRLEKPFTGEQFAVAVRRTMVRTIRDRAS